MIQLLATKYRKHIAYSFSLVFYTVTILPLYGMRSRYDRLPDNSFHSYVFKKPRTFASEDLPVEKNKTKEKTAPVTNIISGKKKEPTGADKMEKADIGGPTQPEMSRFKSAGADNLVNLFTGDFSYNIPLLDVGGYPVNIFYDGGITPEQEASWVGLGWNINPGTVNRNMRGVPDDFDGTDVLKQTQLMKPNVTWGFSAGYDLELVGIKELANIVSGSVGASLDLSFNNYLGPALGLGLKGTTNIKIAAKAGSEKSPSVGIGGGIAANINSRSGVTLSPSVSLTANAFGTLKGFSTGVGLSTNYNSRTGIKQLQITEQMSYNVHTASAAANYYANKFTSQTLSTPITFAKPSYIPTLRMPLTNEAFSGRFQLGNALFGVYGSGEIEGYKQVSRVAQPYQEKFLVGYMYYQNAVNNPNMVMDFTRFNDNEVTPNTPIISAPQYAYDVFSIQGEGTGGTIRAYRDDLGYVRDNITRSQDKSISGGVDVGIPGHYGANFNMIKTPTVISEWKKGNKLRTTAGFKPSNKLEESVYFRNPGETSVLNSKQFDRVGGTDLVRFKLGGTNAAPTIEPYLEHFSKTTNTVTGIPTDIRTIPTYERKKRTQVINFLRADEASQIGLDKIIKNYKSNTVLTAANNLDFDQIQRVSEYRKVHHISQVNVTEASGRRYIYGLPVYNTTQKDFTFSVNNAPTADDQVAFDDNHAKEQSLLLSDKTKDGFVQITETPAYAHSFLLTGLLSPDYVDVTGNGISEDDLGDAVKFNYTRYDDHQWRTPLSTQDNIANFNDGNRSEKKDDKGMVSYGKRESWYLHSIESKTMIALFTLEDRKDGKGVTGEQGKVKTDDNSQKRLKKIDLYSKSDVKKNGLGTNGAKPIKTVRFTYSYSLCANTPSNNNVDNAEMVDGVNVNSARGKLTLDGIYFTFNGKDRTNKNKYVFSYGNGEGNPAYALNASDRWGNYKPATNNPVLDPAQPSLGKLKNSDYPYSDQAFADQNAGAWSLKKILLPSGGQIEVEYESDDYAFVQNRRAATMMRIAGLGKDQTGFGSKLYENGGTDNFYVFIEVPDANVDIKKTYLEGLEQLAFKLAVNMPKGLEYINCYAYVDGDNYGKLNNSNTTIWVKLKPARDGVSPLSLSVLDYLRERLPGQAFRGYDVSESTGLKQIADILGGMGDALKGAFKDPITFLRSQRKAQSIIVARSFVRLNDNDGHKYGGGQRVKSVVLKDNWQAMTGQYTSTYGQKYDYTTTEIFNGVERPISSGVASYEPSIGSEENPFQSIVEVSTKLPLGPASYGAIEMPVLDAFFPAPVVGYSKVTVRSIQQGNIPSGKKSRSGIGKQVTEFYTAKDFPVYYNHTLFDPSVDKTYHDASVLNFFYKYAIDTRALSQGFIVETNDMHGKLKSQASYAEGDEKTRINYTENFYRNTGSNGLNDKFDFIYASKGGTIEDGNMGIDVELMTDTREFSVKSTSYDVQGQVDLFPVIFPFWLPFIWQVSGNSENTYRAVTTIKAISYHGILDRVVVIDKGSMVTTKNLVYDAETGDVIVSETQNEFDKPVYNVNYPAYWAYSGMGLAYKNIDAVYSGVTFTDGKIAGGMTTEEINNAFESGDELYITHEEASNECQARFSGDGPLIWVFNKNKDNDNSALTDKNPDFVFIDKNGKLYTHKNVSFKIVRSGKRNMLNASVAGVTLMIDPTLSGKLVIGNSNNVVNASAIEYKEKWQTDNDVIKKIVYGSVTTYPDGYCPATTDTETPDCIGELERYINPYRKGLVGNFRTHKSMVFYGLRKETDPLEATNLKQNGFLDGFDLYWNFNTDNNLVPVANAKWVWNNEVARINARGLELETKDALDIYTAAQYGYNKTIPVAIANNARYDEMFYEGFEDKDYKESINSSDVNSCTKHIDFSGMPNSQIVPTDLINFNAHSGKSVLAINGNSASKTFSVANPALNTFNLRLYPDSKNFGQWMVGEIAPRYYRYCGTQLLDVKGHPFGDICGGNCTHISKMHPYQWEQGCYQNINPCGSSGDLTIVMQFFYKATASGNFNFTSFMNDNGGKYTLIIRDNPGLPDVNFGNLISNQLLEGTSYSYSTPAYNFPFNCTGPIPMTNNFQHKLCKDNIYEFIILYKPNPYAFQPTSCGGGSFCPIDLIGCGISMNSVFNQVYATKYQQDNICNFTKPVAATASMLNPTFSIPANKKMVFSAWVKESCFGPCTTYVNNKVTLQYNGGSSQVDEFKPSGPIIEGWQRMEGYFTAPQNVTTATLNFINTSSSTIYFDDIRIHPFNANMTSYVYDPVNLRLTAQLDANNYASFYEYDEEGTLIRTKAETKQGVKTVTETRSFKQTTISQLQ